MAATKTIQKLTHQEAVVKIAATAAADTSTIDLDVDLLLSAGEILDEDTFLLTVTDTSGTFKLTYDPAGVGAAEETFSTIAYNADAAAVETALEANSNITDVVVTGTLATGMLISIKTADGQYGSSMSITSNSLSGGSSSIVQTHIGKQPLVNIVGLSWTGHFDTIITLSRNSDVVFTLPCTAATQFDLEGQFLPPDTNQNASNIVATFTDGLTEATNAGAGAGSGQVWMKLRKIQGFRTTIETAVFGSLDNITLAGQ